MSSSPDSSFVLRLPRRALKIAGIAFGLGFALFVVAWLGGRRHDFYTTGPAVTEADDVQSEPLPEPLAAKGGASDMPDPLELPPASDEAATTENPPAPAAAPPPATPVPAPAPVAELPVPAAPTAPALAPGDLPVPIPGQTPQPEYPPDALRRGQSGNVRLRVEVDVQGIPVGVAVVDRSGSRELDRAAVEAVRQWRFQPAQRNGQAVPGTLEIPFEFKTGP